MTATTRQPETTILDSTIASIFTPAERLALEYHVKGKTYTERYHFLLWAIEQRTAETHGIPMLRNLLAGTVKFTTLNDGNLPRFAVIGKGA